MAMIILTGLFITFSVNFINLVQRKSRRVGPEMASTEKDLKHWKAAAWRACNKLANIQCMEVITP